MLLENRTAIVTGGANGIGRGISLLFAEEGCSIAIADLDEKAANETLEEISKRGSDGIFVRCDHTKSDQVQNMVEKVIEKYGKIDILVNNAGWFGQFTPIAELTEDLDPPDGLFNAFGHLGLHQAGSTLLYQGLEFNAVDEVDGIENIAFRL